MQVIDEDRDVLRWGGLAGILGGIIFIVVFVVVIAFVGAEPAQPEGEVMRFPDIRAARTVEDGLYLVVVVAATVLLVDPLSPSAFVGVLALIVFHPRMRWKVYSLSRAV